MRGEREHAVTSSGRWYLAGILVLACAVRVGAMLLLQTWSFPSERDFGAEEGEIAYALATGQGFSWPATWRPVGPPDALIRRDHPEPTTWKAPIYPSVIGLAFWVLGPYSTRAAIALELLQILLSLMTCYVLFRLGSMVFGESAGLIAAAMFAVYPASLHFSLQKVEYGPLLTLLGLLILKHVITLSRSPSASGSVAVGTLFGIATLVNPVILACYPWTLLWFMWRDTSQWRRRFAHAVAVSVCCAAIMTPWLVRNYFAFGDFVFIRPNFARELVLGSYGDKSRALDAIDPAILEGNDAYTSRWFSEQAVTFVRQNPAQFLQRTARRIITFWTYVGDSQGLQKAIAGAAYASVLCLGAAGLWAARRNELVQLFIIYVMTMPLPFYVTWAARGRFRFPVEPVLILGASYALTSLVSRWSRDGHHGGVSTPVDG